MAHSLHSRVDHFKFEHPVKMNLALGKIQISFTSLSGSLSLQTFDCCFPVGVLYMMGERLAWMQQNKDTFAVSYGYIDIKCRY